MKKRMIFFILIIIIFSSLYSVSFPERVKKPNFIANESTRADSAHGFDVLSYDISIEIDEVSENINGIVMAVVEADEIITEIQYELSQMSIDNVLLNGNAATYSYSNDIITIQLGTMNPGEQFTTTVEYSGNPIWNGLGMYISSNYIFTISDPNASRYWWPCYDHPWDKALIDLHITVREDWDAACNGLRTSIIPNPNGTRTHNWEGSNPMATYLVSIVARNFVELNDNFGTIPIQNFVPSAYVTNAIEDFSNLPFMMEVYSDHYGMYPFEKYGNAVTNFATYAAMEHQTMTTLANYLITGNHTYETVIAHELAHQWFGDCLTPLTWADVWLSEGFATYSEAVYTQAWLGFEAMVDYVDSSFHNYYINWAGGSTYIVYDPPPGAYFTPATYEKPASVLHMLRLMVGDEVFFNILQTYFSAYYNSNVITSEFQEVCENVSGLNLEQFFQQWIFQPGLPSMEYTYFISASAATTEFMSFIKTTSNSSTDFYMQAPIHINYDTYHDSILVEATPNIPQQTICQITSPEFISIEFDPNNWVLSKSNVYKACEINNAYAADGKVLICWNEFWDEVDVDGYNLYRSNSSSGPFEIINTALITGISFEDTNVTNGITYYYRLKAVKDVNFETPFSEIYEATPMEFPLDQGILVIDETKDGNGSAGNPDDVMVDDFYQSVINSQFTSYDYADEGIPGLEFLANFSTIIWHDDDLNQHYIEDNINNLGCYLAGGGNLLISGWKTANEIPNYFINDFINCNQTQLIAGFEFTGASSTEYPDINIDPDQLSPAFNGKLPYSCIFPEATNGIYYFEGITGSPYIGEVCALKNESEGTVILMGFPLYYMHNEEVEDFFDQFLIEIGEVGTDDLVVNPNKFYSIAYPNPFNPTTTISFNLTAENAENAELEIYNLKGQKVKTLVNEKLNAGQHSVSWSGNDENGRSVSSGIYFYKLKAGDFEQTKKMMLLK
ncbi:MAG: T9SS type A sorting domain-containing protein [Candidatus Cloacimonetes bacterium]|nr:T9SS type A sorting domain-containing protein [Candidatus Cloacimonadota bacterium]